MRPTSLVVLLGLLTAIAASACGSTGPTPLSSSPPSGIPGAVVPRFPGYLRVEVTPDARVLVEEIETTVVALENLLDSMAATPPLILYHRSNPNDEPPPIFADVLDAIASRRLPVQLVVEDFTAPDYSPPPPP